MISSFEDERIEQRHVKPRIVVLEIRHRDHVERPAIAHLVVERREEVRRRGSDNSVTEASITLSYEVITDRHLRNPTNRGNFSGSYVEPYGVSLISSSYLYGAVFVDPAWLRGHRVGTYLMNEVVTWAKRWPDAQVKPIELQASDAHADNKERRNRLYEQFGLQFDYGSSDRCAGQSKPITTGDLTPVEKWKENITEHRMLDFLSDSLTAKKSALHDLRLARRSNDELIAAQRSATRHPILWALRQLI